MPTERFVNFDLAIDRHTPERYLVRADSERGQVREPSQFDPIAPEIADALNVMAAESAEGAEWAEICSAFSAFSAVNRISPYRVFLI